MLDKIYGYDDANLTTYNGSEPFANEFHRNTSMGQITLPMQIGILVAAKPLLEMFSNIIVGFFVERSVTLNNVFFLIIEHWYIHSKTGRTADLRTEL